MQSNCISIEPLETKFGRKRTINQSSCNTDMSCVKGFCPSFVELEGAKPAQPGASSASREEELVRALRPVEPPCIGEGSFNVLFAGIGGSGVLTVGALLGAAALVDRKVSNVLDFTGLAQKNGAVLSQVRIGHDTGDIHASRIGPGSADLLIGADLVYAASDDIAERLSPMRSAAVVNVDLTPTAAVVRDRDADLPFEAMAQRVKARCVPGASHAIDAHALTTALFGESTTAHVLMLGFAWQKGLLPVSVNALEIAIGSAVMPKVNLRAFTWGRIAAQHPEAAEALVRGAAGPVEVEPQNVDDLVQVNAKELGLYQDGAYATRYVQLVNRVRNAERAVMPNSQALARTVAVQAFRLMAYKDEYEVARLYASKEFKASIHRQFDGVDRMSVWLAPPLISRLDPATGRPKKMKFGPWVFKAFSVLAALKGLRGGVLDPFGRHPERVAERALVEDYVAMVDELVKGLKSRNHADAVTLAALPGEVRGYGPVKMAAMSVYQERKQQLLAKFQAPAYVAIAKVA